MSQTDLQCFINDQPLVNSHEHQVSNEALLAKGPDIIRVLFDNYLQFDFLSADKSMRVKEGGFSYIGEEESLDPQRYSIGERWERLQKVFSWSRHTSAGKPVRQTAELLFGIREFSAAELEAGQRKLEEMWKDGMRLSLLKDKANLDHIQIDSFQQQLTPDSEDADFFLYDINVCGLANASFLKGHNGNPSWADVFMDGPRDSLKTLRQGIEAMYEKYGPLAIATKSQHAYNRTLQWQERSDDEAEQALRRLAKKPENANPTDEICLSDWAFARCIEASSKMNLPVKIHTGYYAGNGNMLTDRIRPGNLCSLLKSYTEADFVLMHIGYPYTDEMIALAKHFPNVYVDMCWAWSIDQVTCTQFLRKFLSAVPFNKLFLFGGDTFEPFVVPAYAQQARDGLCQTLQSCISEGFLNEKECLEIAGHLMFKNQYRLFDIEGTRDAIRKDRRSSPDITSGPGN
ncbi:MAG: amidohydrolase family protein [Puniceicoccaceae bacterium]